jgi:hypothetical protein
VRFDDGTPRIDLPYPDTSPEDHVMNRLLAVGGIALAVLFAGNGVAQDNGTLQRFPLHKAIPESGITACMSQDVPIRVNTLLAKGNDAEAAKAFEQALRDGQCINGAGVVVYTRQVHRLDADDGSVWTVYEGSAGRVKFFVPMHGYLHEDLTV